MSFFINMLLFIILEFITYLIFSYKYVFFYKYVVIYKYIYRVRRNFAPTFCFPFGVDMRKIRVTNSFSHFHE